MNVLYTRSTKCVCGGEGAGIFNGLLSFFINHVFVGVRFIKKLNGLLNFRQPPSYLNGPSPLKGMYLLESKF